VTLVFRRAEPSDEEQAVALVLDRVKWLRERGSDQWSTRDQAVAVRDSIKARNTWVLCDGPRPVGTLAVSTMADPEFWTDQDRDVPALYITKMATALSQAGQGLGGLLLDCVASYGQARGISVIRWDAWRTNPDLHRYYAALLGVRHLRTVPGLASGALFELASTESRSTDIEIVNPTTTCGVFPTVRQAPLGLAAVTGTHRLRVPDLTVLGDSDRSISLLVGGGLTPVVWQAGDHWRIYDGVTQALNAPPFVVSGRPYNVQFSPDKNVALIIGDLT
jgi:hypothetical protein